MCVLFTIGRSPRAKRHPPTQSALLDQWTQFLISDSLIPANQISTDDFAGPLANQTNLAIKGIVGIGAMAKIETLLGNTAKSSNYSVRVILTRLIRLHDLDFFFFV
jgi:hypothetical protein